MDTRFLTFICLFFLQILNLFSGSISENDIRDLVSFKIESCLIKTYPGVKYSTLVSEQNLIFNVLFRKLLNSAQGQFLFQALLFQQKELLQKKGIHLKITITLGNSDIGSCTTFSYDEKTKIFYGNITLAFCEHVGEISTIARPSLIYWNGYYRLYKIKIPDFIILAHELLHVLNHAELLSYANETIFNKYLKALKDSDKYMRSEAIQDFLKIKLGIVGNPAFLEDRYCVFWQNLDCRDSLDEITTILCSFHYVNNVHKVRIGETLFLRELYGKKIVSWTHYIFEGLETNSNFKPAILDFFHVRYLLHLLGLETENLTEKSKENISLKVSKIGANFRHTYHVSETSFNSYTFLKEKFIVDRKFKKNEIPNSREEILREVFPKSEATTMAPSEEVHAFGDYNIFNVPGDGNCAFWAVLVASGTLLPSTDYSGVLDTVVELRKAVANLAEKANVDPDFVNLLRTSGQWNASIHGGVGLEALHYIARHLGRWIILIENEGGVFSYWNSRENNLVLHAIEAGNIEKFLKDVKSNDKKAIFIYHEGNHFQAIVRK